MASLIYEGTGTGQGRRDGLGTRDEDGTLGSRWSGCKPG